jgi:hypothetical protein
MTLGQAPPVGDEVSPTVAYCESRLAPNSIYRLLNRHCRDLFPDTMFADLFKDTGRHCVPPMIVAVVMVLQRLEGLSDREAVDRFTYDVRWKYAAGGLDFDYPEFVHTVLVDFRARLARSEEPKRLFQVSVDIAREAGLVGRRRVLDSTPIYDAVATRDTITLIRSAIRGLLRAVNHRLRTRLRAVITSGDHYTSTARPRIDWSDAAARRELVDSRAKDAQAILTLLDGMKPDDETREAAVLLATVIGQDLDQGDDGVFRIARRVARDRVISTVDPEARHGHKTRHRGFDGYKGHLADDPDSEIVTATAVTGGNHPDAEVALDLLADLLPTPPGEQRSGDPETVESAAGDERARDEGPVAYADADYGKGELLKALDDAGVETRIKVQPPANTGGRYTKDAFSIDLDQETVTCPAGVSVPIVRDVHGDGTAQFGGACAGCALAQGCTKAAAGRTVTVGRHEAHLAKARAQGMDPAWRADYRSTRPKVERKIAHLMFRRHGGRRARVRGTDKVAADFSLLAAAVNLARLAVLGLTRTPVGSWATA